ncbi:MAG: LrgB family protein [Eubacteriales bacterium]|nr:LrgB family protein [Eubacteriales bacterium]
MTELLSSSSFWLCLSIGCYALGQKIQQKTGSPLCNPLLIASVLVGALLVLTGTSYQTYNESGRLIAFFLTPATVALAVPIYRKLDVLKKNLLPILSGALVGSVVSIGSVIGFCRLFGLSDVTTRSLVPKSVTTPIGVALSEMLGGLAPVTTIAIIFTGIVGAILLPAFLKCIGVRNPVQMGLSMGTAAHAVGTSRAIELGETEGAISGLAIGVAGLLTALLVSVGSVFVT